MIVSLAAGAALAVAFVINELRSEAPMPPMEFFANRGFAVTNVVSLAMYFGMFGSIFFLSQFFQNVLGNTPLQAGVKLLVWTGATMLIAPLAGIFSERFGARWFMVAGLALQAIALGWLASVASVHSSYVSMIGPFILAGAGMALVFAPSANAVLASVRSDQAGRGVGCDQHDPGTGRRPRDRGPVDGVHPHGGYSSPQAFVHGMTPAPWVATVVLGVGSLTALVFPFNSRATALAQAEVEEALRTTGRRSSQATACGCRPDGRVRSLTDLDGDDDYHIRQRSKRVSASRRQNAGTRADRSGGPRVCADGPAWHARRPDRPPGRRRSVSARVQPVRMPAVYSCRRSSGALRRSTSAARRGGSRSSILELALPDS